MQLLTQELRKKLPALYSTENLEDPVVICKFFLPTYRFTWYATEFDGKNIFFGFVVGHETELGYFTLEELEMISSTFGLKVERDLYFDPQSLSTVMKWHI